MLHDVATSMLHAAAHDLHSLPLAVQHIAFQPQRAAAGGSRNAATWPLKGSLRWEVYGSLQLRLAMLMSLLQRHRPPCRAQVCLTNKAVLSFFDRRKDKLEFVNIRDPDYSPSSNGGVQFEDAMRHIHVITGDLVCFLAFRHARRWS